jgi:hypothetical protein
VPCARRRNGWGSATTGAAALTATTGSGLAAAAAIATVAESGVFARGICCFALDSLPSLISASFAVAPMLRRTTNN